MCAGQIDDPMGSRLMDIAEERSSILSSTKVQHIGQKENTEDWKTSSWRTCQGPCCKCAREAAREKYRESTRALGRANGATQDASYE